VISFNDDVSRDILTISFCTSISPSCTLVISGLVIFCNDDVEYQGGIEVQDEIGQVSRETSSLQDINSPEITKVHEGGIEVDDEIGQVSRD
jgi:hypothetical protein